MDNIKLNEKYTLLIENTMGFIVSRQVRITKAFMEKENNLYGNVRSNEENLVLHYILKGKRKAIGTRFKESRIAIFEGWKDIKGTIQDNNINTFESFQTGLFDDIIKNNKLNALYMQ
jgi:hypothetical protein